MSADDFQTKYSSVMESMLKSAVAETTKLFETMVDELKAEICKLKKENEDLKTKNDQSEKGKSQVPVNARTCEPLKGLSDGFEKRDTATQCDLVPVRTMVVEQCEPLRDLSLQNQKEQWLYEDMNYGLQEHDYVSHENADSQMAHIQVKQESVLKEEDDEPMLVCGQVVSDKGSHLASACGTEKKGFHVNQEFSTESISLPHKVEETTVAMELASLEMTSGPQVQNLSSDPEHSPVISFATIKDDLGEESDNNIKISEIGSQAEIGTSPDNSLVIVLQPTGKEQHCQRTGEMSVQSDVTVQQDHSVNHIEKRLAEPAPCEQDIADEALKSSMVKEKSGSERICRKRGRPLKRAKHLQQLEKVLPSASASLEQRMVIQPAIRLEEDNISSVVDTVNTTASVSSKLSPMKSKEISFVSNRDRINSALATNVQVGSLEKSLKKSSSTNKEKTSESQKLSTETTEAKIQSPAKKDVFTTETNASQTPSNEPSHHCSPVTIQDAMLLVEAMNQSTVENASPSSGPLVGKVQTVNDIPAKSVMPRLPVFVGTLPVTALSTSVLSKGDVKAKAAPKTKDAALNIKAQSQLEGVRPNPQHVVTPVSTTKLPVVLSKTVTQTSTGSHQKRTLDPLSVAPSNLNNTGPPKIIFLQNSTLIMPHTMAALSTTQSSTVVTTVVRNTGLQTSSTVARSFPETSSHSRVPSKTIYVTTGPLLPIVTSTSSVTLRDQQGGSLANSKVKIVTPRQSTFVLTTKQDTATSASSAVTQTNSSTVASQLSSSSQELKDSSNIQTTSHKVVTFPQKTDDTSDNLESPKQTITVPETPNTLSKSCSSSNRPLGQAVPSVCPVKPPMVEQKFSAMVRLTRLPFPVSTEKSVLVSQLILDRTSEPQSTLKDNLTQTKPPERPEILSMTEPSIQLTAFASKDASDPHLQMTKTQFLAQLAVSPRSEAPEKASSNELPDSTVCREKMSDKVSPVARLQSHLKGHMEIRRPEVNTEPCMETETSTAGPETFSLEIEEPNGNVTEPFPLCPKSGTVVVEVDTLNKNTTKPTPIRSDQCEEHVTSINSVSKLNNASSSLNKDTTMPRNKKSTSQSPRRTSTTKVASSPKNTKSTSQSPRRTSATKVASSPKNTKSTSQSPRRISTTRENSSPKNTKSTSQSPRRSSTNKEDSNPKNTKFTPQSPRRSSTTREDSSPKNTKSTSQSSRRSSTTREDSSPKNTKSTSQTPRRTSTTRAASSLKNTKSTSMSPRRSSTTGEDSSPKNTKSTSQSPRRTSTIREVSKNAKLIQRASIAGDVASPKLAKSTSVSPKRTNSTRGGSSPKITNTTHVSPRRTNSTRGGSSLQKTKTDSVSPRMSKNTGDSMSGDNRRSSFTKGNANPQNKRKSNSFSPRRFSVTTGGALSKKVKSETASPSMRSLGKRGVSPTRTRESTPAKKQRLHQDSTGSKTNLRILNAKKLAKAAKAKSIAKIKISQQKLHDESNTSQITENQANSQAVKKITCKAVWIPPKMPVTKPPKEETKSQDVEAVYPPNNCVHRIPVKAPPMVSPLQPLLVIGGHLLKNQCGECGRILSSCAALESHVRLHIGRRPFSCTLCGKSFPDSKGLKRHGRVHRNGRIHVCPQCGKGFVYRFGLTKHLQMVHGRLKPFVCQICNKGFYTKRDVEAHIRIHTGEKPFHCNLCDKKFARRVELNVHLRWHNGEKRHWCPYCGKGFLDFNNLKRHKYIHTGEKPHSCPHCSKRFTQSGHLKKHVKNVHKIK